MGSLVLDSTSGGHHHAPSDGVNGVAHEARGHRHGPSEEERESHSGVSSEDDGLEGVVQTEVHSSVETLDTIRLQGLGVDINETIKLSLASLALSIISKPGPGVVKRVDEQEGHCSGGSTTGNVGTELHPLRSVLRGLEEALDLVLEGEVKGLCGKVPQHVGEISSPEGVDALSLEDPGGTVDDTGVGLVETSLLDHLILVLNKELPSLDGSCGGLGDSSRH